ncbi:hypothetical protein LguiA_012011 [Lonicera macranthoides]
MYFCSRIVSLKVFYIPWSHELHAVYSPQIVGTRSVDLGNHIGTFSVSSKLAMLKNLCG